MSGNLNQDKLRASKAKKMVLFSSIQTDSEADLLMKNLNHLQSTKPLELRPANKQHNKLLMHKLPNNKSK